jgi:hypothetical protein
MLTNRFNAESGTPNHQAILIDGLDLTEDDLNSMLENLKKTLD